MDRESLAQPCSMPWVLAESCEPSILVSPSNKQPIVCALTAWSIFLLQYRVPHTLKITLQVSLVLTLELTLLPALHGCWVDLCMLPLFDANWGDRTAWFRSSPVSFLLVHWVLGMAFLMGIATFLSILRQQLRPGESPMQAFPTAQGPCFT